MDTAISSNLARFWKASLRRACREYADQLMLYGHSWAIAGERSSLQQMEHSHIHTGYSFRLGARGRAIQDLWITPPREGKK